MQIRLLIGTKESGTIIGKGGANIKKLRETTGADIKLAEPPVGSPRRVCSVSGTLSQVSVTLAGMVDLLCSHPELAGEDGTSAQPFMVTLLIGNEVIGACIGKAGSVIRETRDTSGAHIKVSQVPLDGSTEKTMDIKGSVAQISMACDMIMQQLATMGMRDGAVPMTRIPWDGTTRASSFAPSSNFGAASPSSYDQYGGQQQYGQQQYTPSSYGGYQGYPPPPPLPPPSSYGDAKRQVVIPVASALVGSLIGKSGTTIRRIRDTSRAEVRVADSTPGVEQRNVTITGTEATTQVAVSMIYEALGQPSPIQQQGGGGSYYSAPGSSHHSDAMSQGGYY